MGIFLGLAALTQGHAEETDLKSAEQRRSQMSADEQEALQLNRRVRELATLQQIDAAIPLARRALALSEKFHGAVHRNVSADLITLADLYRRQGDFFNAESMISRAIEVDKKLHGTEHPEVAMDMGSLAMLYLSKGDLTSAAKTFRVTVVLLAQTKDLGRYLRDAAEIHYAYGMTLAKLNERETAKVHLSNAEQMFEATGQKSRAIEVLVEMAEYNRAAGNQAEAEMLLRRADQLRSR